MSGSGRFRCLHGHTLDCQTKIQSRQCAENYQLLTGLSHLNERRAALMTAGGNFERTFREGRARFGRSSTSRPNAREHTAQGTPGRFRSF